jgi:multiple sugar transport system ATP-binding protein
VAEVQLENVEKIYPGGCRAVHDLNLHVREGEYLVLVGPSACGKTTTLRLIAGLEDVSAGTLRIGGRTVNNVAPKDRDVSMVFQNFALYPHMTVRQNMAFGLRMRKLAKKQIEERVQWAAETLGIDQLLRHRPKALSGGQRQRVAVGRAMVRRPQVFLFDEPLSNLDAQLRVEMRGELKRLHRQLNTTTIHVTHDQEEAMTLGDRVAVMCDGQVHQCDAPLSVYRHPANRFVAGFVGMPAMNFIEGALCRRDDAVWFETPGIQLRLPPHRAAEMSGHIDRDLALGIRPEWLHPDSSHNEDTQLGRQIDVTVDAVETLGGDMNLIAHTSSGQRLVARAPAIEIPAGSQITLSVDLEGAHLFEPNGHEDDPNTPTVYGRNLTLGKQS